MARRVVLQCTAPGTGLPPNKPRYVMGIGYPLDIVLCSAMGADMFDSVYPTRTARFGVALVGSGTLKLRNSAYAEDFRWALQPLLDCWGDQSDSCLLVRPSTLKLHVLAHAHRTQWDVWFSWIN